MGAQELSNIDIVNLKIYIKNFLTLYKNYNYILFYHNFLEENYLEQQIKISKLFCKGRNSWAMYLLINIVFVKSYCDWKIIQSLII